MRRGIGGLVGVLLVVGLGLSVGFAPGSAQRSLPVSGWSEPALLFSAGVGSPTDEVLGAKAAVGQGVIFVVWAQRVAAGAGGQQAADIFLARSDDGGETFSVLNLSQSPAVDSRFPDLWVTGGTVYVVWEEGTGQAKEILLARSRDRGQSFEPPVNVSNTPNREDRDARVVADFRRVVVVWEQVSDRANDSDIFFAFSRDGGQTFSSPRNLSSTSGTLSTAPRVALSGPRGTFYVAWEDEPLGDGGATTAQTEIFFTTIELQGQTETVGPRLNVSNTPETPSLNPKLVASRSRVFLAWEEGGTSTIARDDREARLRGEESTAPTQDREIYLAVSADGGQSFNVVNVSNTPEFDSRRPALALAGMQTLLVAWEEEEGALDDSTVVTTGRTDIWFTRSPDGGETFFPPLNLSHSFGVGSRNVVLLGGQRKVFLAWEEDVGAAVGGGARGREILFTRSLDGGETFQAAQVVSRSLARVSRLPRLVLDNRVVVVLWEERAEVAGTQPGFQLAFTRNEAEGAPFQARGGRVRAVSVGSVSALKPAQPPSEARARAVVALGVEALREGRGWSFRVHLPGSAQGAARVRLSVYDLAGRTVFRAEAPIGDGDVGWAQGERAVKLVWPLRDRAGRPVAHGIYLYRVELRDAQGMELRSEVRKLVVLR